MTEEQKKNRRKIDLTSQTPIKVIVLFAIPLCIGQLFHLLYTLVDTRMVGQILGEEKLAAVGATTTVCDMMIGFINGLTNGFGIVVARYYGAKDNRNLKRAHAGACMYGILVTLFLSMAGVLLLQPILNFLNVPEGLQKDSGLYLGIMSAGLLATGIYNIGAASLRAVGDSYTPLLFLIISSVLNIGLDYLFMAVLEYGVAGAAVATVLAQALSAICCQIYMYSRHEVFRLSKQDLKPELKMAKDLFAAGVGMGFMVSFVQLGTVILQTAINTFEDSIIVAHTAARKATSLFMLPFSVFGSAMATYSGQNVGAKKYDRIRKGVRQTLCVVWGWCAFVFILNQFAAPMVIHLITASDTELILETGAAYLRFNTTFYFITAVITVFRNTMQGYGDAKTPLFSSALELIGKTVIALLLVPAVGYRGVIVSEPIVWAVMVIPLIVNMLRSDIWKFSKTH